MKPTVVYALFVAAAAVSAVAGVAGCANNTQDTLAAAVTPAPSAAAFTLASADDEGR
jgi:ABC-type phosphate transport system substrate-binding protein